MRDNIRAVRSLGSAPAHTVLIRYRRKNSDSASALHILANLISDSEFT